MQVSQSSWPNHLSKCSKEEVLITGHSSVRMAFSRYNMRYRWIQKNLERLYRRLLDEKDAKLEQSSHPFDQESYCKEMKGILNEVRGYFESEFEHLDDIYQKTKNLQDMCQQPRPNTVHAYRLIAEFLLRRGHYEAGSMLAEQLGISSEFNLETFKQMVEIRNSLLNGNPEPFLEWAARHAPKLKQFKNRLENSVRLLFIRDKLMNTPDMSSEGVQNCLRYAREFVRIEKDDFVSAETLGSVMVLFIIPSDMLNDYCPNSKAGSDLNWKEMADQFITYFFHANLMGLKNPFEAILEAGLLVTKSPSCYASDEMNEKCPTCHPLLRRLSSVLPFPHRTVSEIVCRYTNEKIDEKNPGMMLPNGQVYGQSAIKQLTRADGSIRCPITGDVYPASEAKRIFIV